MDLKIIRIGLPGAAFETADALASHGPIAEQREAAFRDYDETGDEATLWENLRALGFDRHEIAWHVAHRGARMQIGYV